MLAGFQPFAWGGRGLIYGAYAAVTAPVIYTTAAGTGGPLLWNGSAVGGGRGVTAYLLAMSYGLTVASTVAGALGITGNSGQLAAPGSTSAITASQCIAPIGGSASQCNVYNVGTPSSAGNFFLPTGHVHTGALTVDTDDDNWIHLGGAVAVPPGSWASVAASATLTTAVIQIGLVWIEIPND